MKLFIALGFAALAGALIVSEAVRAQGGPSAPPAGPPPSAQKAAPIDLTGYWAAVVSEDWRWRMMTPAKGDYASVPLNVAGRRIADEFDPALYGGATDNGSLGGGAGEGQPVEIVPIGRYQVSGIIDCRAYGAAGIMRMPTRVHISWQDPNTLKLDTDWGQQTREFHFVPGRPLMNPLQPTAMPAEGGGRAAASLQGNSVAAWELPYRVDAPFFQRGNRPGPAGRGGLGGLAAQIGNVGDTGEGGDLAVFTSNLAPGWLRRNGVPYGERTRLIEHFQIFQDPSGASWFDVTTQVIDPEYLTGPFLTSSDFQKEPDGSKWAPHPCKQVTKTGATAQ